jgi:hypothetical protein
MISRSGAGLRAFRSEPFHPLTDCRSSRRNTRLPRLARAAFRLTWFGRSLDRVKLADFPALAFPSACGSPELAPCLPARRMSPRASLIHGALGLRHWPLACWFPQLGGPSLSASSRWVQRPPPIRFSLCQAPEANLCFRFFSVPSARGRSPFRMSTSRRI